MDKTFVDSWNDSHQFTTKSIRLACGWTLLKAVVLLWWVMECYAIEAVYLLWYAWEGKWILKDTSQPLQKLYETSMQEQSDSQIAQTENLQSFTEKNS